MISYRDFKKILTEIESKIDYKYPKDHPKDNPKRNFKNVWSYSLECWCHYFDVPPEAQVFIINWGNKKQVKSFSKSTWLEWNPKKERDLLGREKEVYGYFYHFLQENFFYKNNMEMKSIIIILLLSFIATAIGYFLYFQSSKNKETKKTHDKVYNNSNLTHEKTKESLILVINERKYNNISHLKTQRKITHNDSEIIYRATESMWTGLPNKIPSQLNECFSSPNQFQVPKGEESEYDIYMIKIELDELDKGFKAEADQLARIDAFRSLPDLSRNITVSDRLKVSAYKNTGVYKR